MYFPPSTVLQLKMFNLGQESFSQWLCVMIQSCSSIIQWWASHSHITLKWLISKSYSILFKWSSASIFSIRVPNWRHESLNVFRIAPPPPQNYFWLWEYYPVVQGWLWGKESQSKMLIKLHLSQSKTAHNLVMRIGTIKTFGGIQMGASNNQRKCLLMPE